MENKISKAELVKAWSQMYGENFKTEYSGLFRKLPETFTLSHLVKSWDEMYGEDFKVEYSGLYRSLNK